MKKVNKYLYGLFCIAFFSFSCKKNELISTKEKNIDILTQKNIQKEESIIGKYILSTCENGRFSLEIINRNGNYFKIFDRNRIISKGKISIDKSEKPNLINLGKIDGLFYGDSIVIQNYGNSMNEYNHFTQCDKKYLSFIKKE